MNQSLIFRWIAFFCLLCELVVIGGWYFLDWKLTSTLPISIGLLVTLFSSLASSFAVSKWLKTTSILLFTISFLLSMSYLLDWVELVNCWQLMMILLVLSIQVALIAIWTKIQVKRKMWISIPSLITLTGLCIHLFFESETFLGMIGIGLSGIFVLFGLILKRDH